MRTGGLLCRSQAATAVCVPGDARSMVAARRADRAVGVEDVRYARLGGGGGDQPRRSTSRRFAVASCRGVPPPPPPPQPRRRGAGGGRAPVAVTLPMVTRSPVREAPVRGRAAAAKRAPATVAATAAAASSDQALQVVVMKVAIHCRGCAGKVRKHISKMEGVTSFSIDLESKKVTVTGHVSPAGVLESVSKIKKAELLAV